MNPGLLHRTIFLVALLLGGSMTIARAQGSAFSYQGTLTSNSLPANGQYDLSFELFDALSGGNSAAANLNSGGQSAVAGGGVILSEQPHNSELLDAGYLQISKVDLVPERWRPRAGPAPSARSLTKGVWTGKEMLVFGGDSDGVLLSDLHCYVPPRTFFLYLRP